MDEEVTNDDYAFVSIEQLKLDAAKAAEEEEAGIFYTLEEVDKELDAQIEAYYKNQEERVKP